eukprot:CAMPEP_0173237320 /NCGR_PEP_ID=MMETSP1142-20121109/11982_1 /TAXON_ID=483371 /ORGANISM="non described non described, Strain CCMP2298" /LENGTH=111 /DNA_ID=CAMNT_0014167991 /DNA_START=606 /DNA_END=942 /DNA_ORIENTATION=-
MPTWACCAMLDQAGAPGCTESGSRSLQTSAPAPPYCSRKIQHYPAPSSPAALQTPLPHATVVQTAAAAVPVPMAVQIARLWSAPALPSLPTPHSTPTESEAGPGTDTPTVR